MDYFETFAPVARLASIHLILAIAAQNDWNISMFNFHLAYLNGILDEGKTIYMEQPPHHEIVDRTHYVVKLNKSLYGLKQAGRKWYNMLCQSLASIGFRKSMVDPAVFYAVVEQDIVVLFIHVDDSTITGSSLALNKKFMSRIAEHFKITDLGPISWLLGLAVVRDRDKWTISLSQSAYIESLLHRFNLEDTKTLTVPINSNVRLTSEDCPTTVEGKVNMKGVPF